MVPSNFPMPPPMPEKTGTPIAPNSKYAPITKVPVPPPSNNKVSAIANVCKVNGTADGMDIQEQIEINATVNAP